MSTASDNDKKSCCCCKAAPPKPNAANKIRGVVFALLAWGVVYAYLPEMAAWLTSLLPFEDGSHSFEAAKFFLYDTPKILMLLTLVVFFMGVVRSFFSPERTRKLLAGRGEFIGNVLAAMLGIVTPFCSCSAVPLFLGFVSAGVPLGVTFSFLISAPMVNEVALGLLIGMIGWKVAALYLLLGLAVAVLSGWAIGRLRLEGWLEDWVANSGCGCKSGETKEAETISEKVDAGIDAVKDIVGKVWLWVVAGIFVGAIIHGYVPTEFMASIMGRDAWWSVPLAVIVGIPMYSNAAGIIPVAMALLGKGAALGTVLAFMMSVIALSLPEMIILRKVLKMPLILVFVSVVGCGIMLVGYIFNWLL